jgi:hypothetical protein
MAGSGSIHSGLVALLAAVMKFWEGLRAILSLNIAHGKDFARKMGNFLAFLEGRENAKGQWGSTGASGNGARWRPERFDKL